MQTPAFSKIFRTFVVVMNTDFLNIKGKLFSLERPVVMTILNATPDSFVPSTRLADEDAVLRAAERASHTRHRRLFYTTWGTGSISRRGVETRKNGIRSHSTYFP